MSNTPPDWQQIAISLQHLHGSRSEVCRLWEDEFETIENTIHYVNKKLDGFAFRLDSFPDDGDVAHFARIDLLNLAEEEALPWSYRMACFYAGYFDGFLARENGDENHLEALERAKIDIGGFDAKEWESVLGKIATLNLRDTPRPSALA